MKSILTFLFFGLSFLAWNQKNLDSLWGIWSDDKKLDTVRLDALYAFTMKGFIYKNPDSARALSKIQYAYAEEKNLPKFKALALNVEASSYYIQGDYEKAVTIYLASKELYEEAQDLDGVGRALNNIGNVYYNQGKYKDAIEFYQKSLDVKTSMNDKEGQSSTLNNLALIYDYQGKYDLAIQMHQKSLKIREDLDDQQGISTSLNNIGIIYKNLGEIDKALELYQKSLTISSKIEDLKGMANTSYNIGVLIKMQGDKLLEEGLEKLATTKYLDAFDIYRKSLGLSKQLDDPLGEAITLNSMGTVKEKLGQDEEAFELFTQSLKICEEIKDPIGIASAENSIAIYYFNKKNYRKSIQHAERAKGISDTVGEIFELKMASFTLWKSYKELGKSKLALLNMERYIASRDSLQSDQNKKELFKQEYKYQYEKQAAADSIRNAEEQKVAEAELAKEKAENNQRKQQSYFLFGGLTLVLVFAGFIFNRFRITKKQKNIIEDQKEKVDEAYEELEEKNTEIMDSITYAKRIQSAILPPDHLVKKHLPQSFVLYKPKDIVAGDFYWLEVSKSNEQEQEGRSPVAQDSRHATVLIAAADCTGHGVPGAMVSVVCVNGLNRSVREQKLRDPGKILDTTRELVIKEFEKSDDEVKDGMDIAVVSIEQVQEGAGSVAPDSCSKLKYSGAHNPLWIIRKGSTEVEEIKAGFSAETSDRISISKVKEYTLIEVKADKQPIGKFHDPQPFKTHELELKEGDTIYISSDGYADQFGGEKGKKLKSKNFKNLLLSIQDLEMEAQKQKLDTFFEQWRGDIEQIDDVCIIGIRV